MSRVITISGKARCGKNTFADLLKKELENQYKRVTILAYADYVKQLAKTLYGWDGNKDEKGRTILQKFGTDIVRKENPDFWVSIVEQTITVLRKEFDFFIISDARFVNEIEYLKNKGHNVLSIYIERPGLKSNLTEKQLSHPSENGLTRDNCSISVFNKDLYQLEKEAKLLTFSIID